MNCLAKIFDYRYSCSGNFILILFLLFKPFCTLLDKSMKLGKRFVCMTKIIGATTDLTFGNFTGN